MTGFSFLVPKWQFLLAGLLFFLQCVSFLYAYINIDAQVS